MLNPTIQNDRLEVLTDLRALVDIQKRIIARILVTNPDVSRNSLEYKKFDRLETLIMLVGDRIQSLLEDE